MDAAGEGQGHARTVGGERPDQQQAAGPHPDQQGRHAVHLGQAEREQGRAGRDQGERDRQQPGVRAEGVLADHDGQRVQAGAHVQQDHGGHAQGGKEDPHASDCPAGRAADPSEMVPVRP
nr:hypothetical protein [Acrocarpospora catenulata]